MKKTDKQWDEYMDKIHSLPKSGTRKIAELPDNSQCRHPEHNPPSHMVYEDGVYEHICPACGKSKIFTVRNPSL